MRYSRVKTLTKKNKKRTAVFKKVIWIYLLLIMTAFSINFTNGLFTDTTASTVGFDAHWIDDGEWDHSSLTFIGQGGSCNEIYADIKNNSQNSMQSQLRYEVYYVENKNSQLLLTGTSAPLQSGGQVRLTYTTSLKPGTYLFKAYQSPNHPGKGELWSGEITISGECGN